MEQPSARFNHAVAKTESKDAYMFGGYDEKRNRCLGDLHRYEYSMFILNIILPIILRIILPIILPIILLINIDISQKNRYFNQK